VHKTTSLAIGEYIFCHAKFFFKQDCEKKQEKKIIFLLIFIKNTYKFLTQQVEI